MRLRLDAVAREAKRRSFDYFCTTLTSGTRKNSAVINGLGQELSEAYGVLFLVKDFKKKDGVLKSIRFCRENEIYRQSYCGCKF